mgnify:CR=1 FL=1
MASASVLSNHDLVRALLSQSTDAVGLLSTSNAIRHSEPCARLLERWANDGCPEEEQATTAEERRCLEGIGGLDSVFCTGRFSGTQLDPQLALSTLDLSAAALVRKVAALVGQPSGRSVLTLIHVSFAGAHVSLAMGHADARLQVEDEEGRRFKGYPCRITSEEALQLLAALLTRTGRVQLPCPTNPSSAVMVPRRIGIRVTRRFAGEEDEWLLLRGGRR